MRKQSISILLVLTIIISILPAKISYANGVEIIADFDKESFQASEYITGELRVSSDKKLDGQYIAYTVEDEKGLSTYKVGQDKLDKDGVSKLKFKMPYNTKAGVYYLRVASLGKHEEFKINIGESTSKPEEKPVDPEKPVNPEEKPGEKARFKDVDKGFWAHDEIYNLSDKEIIKGYTDGTFRPNNKITRSEFSKIISGFLPESLDGKENNFKDLDKSKWAYGHMNRSVNAGILTGYVDGTLKANQEITRDEATVMIMRLLEYKKINLSDKGTNLEYKDQDEIKNWSKDAIETLTREGIITGVGNGHFAPRREITRAEVAVIINRSLEKYNLK